MAEFQKSIFRETYMFMKILKAATLAAVAAAPISAQAAQAVRASSATLPQAAAPASMGLAATSRAGAPVSDENQLVGTPLWLILLGIGVVVVGAFVIFDEDEDASPN